MPWGTHRPDQPVAYRPTQLRREQQTQPRRPAPQPRTHTPTYSSPGSIRRRRARSLTPTELAPRSSGATAPVRHTDLGVTRPRHAETPVSHLSRLLATDKVGSTDCGSCGGALVSAETWTYHKG